MGKFYCHCGYVISDSEYPSQTTGELRWEPETDWADDEAQRRVAEFLAAVGDGEHEDWIKNYFAPEYPLDGSLAEVVSDIYYKVFNEKGRSVYLCPECERIYVQEEFYTDEWTCYEKREKPPFS